MASLPLTQHPGGQLRDVALSDKWDSDADGAFMSGLQAIARALLDQRRDDELAGLRGGGFVSGYQGSPLGTLDKELQRLTAELDALGIVFQPGVNEELAATAVWGSQMAHRAPDATVDGVTALWYGKNPGLDRASDAIRHATISGVGDRSAAVAVVGDDPAAKSSTLPSAAERTLAALYVPVLAPSSVQDVVDLGRHAFRMSRAAGLWVGLKLVADIADATANVRFSGPMKPVERLVEHVPTAHLLGAPSLPPERHLLDVRLPAAVRYARDHHLNQIVTSTPDDTVGLVAAGSTYAELRRALDLLGFDDAALASAGIRLAKVAMPWPLDDEFVRELALGLDTVVVVEDKLAFLEDQVRTALYGRDDAPEIVGKRDASGTPLLASHGALHADAIARALVQAVPAIAARAPDRATRTRPVAAPLPVVRQPAFCSGCPHSTSTRADSDSLVGAGIGCHVMLVQGGDRGGDVLGLTQMGGEGAQWIGMAPFTERPHLTQNLGDGTFHHSGSLALRAVVAAGVNVTYKLLYNDAVAMTGGQHVEGAMPVPRLAQLLLAEGVARVVVTTDDVARYRRIRLPRGVAVRPRERLAEIERELAAVPGVTVLVHDQMCAAERRRLRRRGTLPRPAARPWINERVCEGCGDCGDVSGCLSVEPVDTEFGRKTRVHQASCNQDMRCLEGDCPSFLTVAPGTVTATSTRPAPPSMLPEPRRRAQAPTVVRMVGIGGTGVVTVSQILAMAGHLEGVPVAGLDQTGMSQKGGSVVSDVRIGAAPDAAPRATGASVDVLLGFDLLTTAQAEQLSTCEPERTTAVLSTTIVPTAAMVTDPAVTYPPVGDLVARVAGHTSAIACRVDARRLAEVVLGDDIAANMIVLGAAWQAGLLPVGWDALRRAVELNGAAVRTNIDALLWGRAVVAAPAAIDAALRPAPTREPSAKASSVAANAGLPEALVPTAAVRIDDLIAWGGDAPARRFASEIARIAAAEAERAPGHTELTASVITQLHRLMAYKDEYEVARLHLLPEERARREAELGKGAKTWVHLHPPVLRALGVQRKLRLRRSATPLFTVLRRLRRLRGTPFDPFGHAAIRRLERSLPAEYLASVDAALAALGPGTHADVVAISELAGGIRGYEDIKLRAIVRWRAEAAAGLAALTQR